MGVIDNISVKIDCKLDVPDQTIECCLKLLEIWQENNPDKYIDIMRAETPEGHKTLFAIGRRTL